MKIVNLLIFCLTINLLMSCTEKAEKKAIVKFEEFKRKEKFIPDEQLFYPGIGDPKQKPILTEKINLVADDFEKLAKRGNATEKEYQNAIKIGLERFEDIYIDSENQERVCHYFEELMDIVGLESSGGQLNNFRYGFDGTQKQQ